METILYSRAVPPGKERVMNQGERLVLRNCIKCGKEIRVKQVYNTHIADWEDIELWMCEDCRKGARENERD